MGRTSIQVSEELADELYSRKQRGESYEDVIWRLIETGEIDSVEPVDRESPPSRRDKEPSRGDVVLHDDIPNTVEIDGAQEAIQAVIDHLREDGAASMREIVAEVMPEHPLGYDVPELEPGDRYRGAWWRRVVKPALEKDERVVKPDTGGSEWQFKEKQ
jgi:hypothetical protein